MADRGCEEPVAEACAGFTVVEHHTADKPTSCGGLEPAEAAEVRRRDSGRLPTVQLQIYSASD